MPAMGVGELQKVRKSMRGLGATRPELARPASDLPEIVLSRLGQCVDACVVREGPAETFYLDDGRASAVLRNQLLKAVVFWFVVILVPVAVLQISRTGLAP